MRRRNRALESGCIKWVSPLTVALERATSQSAKAPARFDLGLILDINGREAQAIPHYRKSLELGIDPAVIPDALAWLASSLRKRWQPTEASLRAGEALRLSPDPSLREFMVRLLRPLDRAVDASQPR